MRREVGKGHLTACCFVHGIFSVQDGIDPSLEALFVGGLPVDVDTVDQEVRINYILKSLVLQLLLGTTTLGSNPRKSYLWPGAFFYW